MRRLGINRVKVLLVGLVVMLSPLALETQPVGGAGQLWWTNTHWPGPEVEAGQWVTVRASVYIKPSILIVSPSSFLTVTSMTLHAFGKSYPGPSGVTVEVARDFDIPVQVPSDAEPGDSFSLRTVVAGGLTVVKPEGGKITKIYNPVFERSSTATIRIKREKKVEAEELHLTLAASFPATVHPGETMTGRGTISSSTVLPMRFVIVSSTFSIPRLGISKPTLSAGTSFTGSESFTVTATIPEGTTPGAYPWTVHITAEREILLYILWEEIEIPKLGQESVSVSGSFEVVKPFPEDDEEEWIEEWVFGFCVVATAAFGSPMHPHVEAMRTFRDEMVMTTYTGSNFIQAFNAWYYSWSPPVAKAISSDETLRQAARLVLYPLVGATQAAEGTYSLLSFNGELAATSSILIAAAICGVAYVAPLILALAFILRRIRMKKTPKIWRHRRSLLSAFLFAALVLTVVGGVGHSVLLSTVGVTVLAVTVTLSASLLTVETLTWARSMVIKQAALGS